MKKMQLLAVFSSAVLFSGCCTFCNKDVQCPQDDRKMPTFDTTLFPLKDKIMYSYWIQKIDENETIIVMKPDDFYNNLEEVGELRSTHNLLINKINEFNVKVDGLNKK